jgi:lipase chaperone LimK
MEDWSITGSTREALDNLARIREYRRSVFGEENADLIFGASEKADEYDIRRRMILADNSMFGFEKERRLAILNEMMWGSETMPYEDNLTSYARYQEKLNLYGRDLSEARSGSEKEAILEKIRRETFTPEELQRLDDTRRHAAYQAQVLDEYYAREKDIRNSRMNQEMKDSLIRDLQNQMFGAQADAFRRQEAITRGLEDALEKTSQDADGARKRFQHLSPEEAVDELNEMMREQQREAAREQ